MPALRWLVLALFLGGCDFYSQTVTWRFEVDGVPGDCAIARVSALEVTPILGDRTGGESTRGSTRTRDCDDGESRFDDLETGDKLEPFAWEGRANGLTDTADVNGDRADLVFVGATFRVRWQIEKAGAPTTCAALAATNNWQINQITFHVDPGGLVGRCDDDFVRTRAMPLTVSDLAFTGLMEVYVVDDNGGQTLDVAEAATTATLTPTGTDATMVFRIP